MFSLEVWGTRLQVFLGDFGFSFMTGWQFNGKSLEGGFKHFNQLLHMGPGRKQKPFLK